MRICPLIFQPIFKPKIWGGRLLEQIFPKQLPPTEPIGESWELADLENDQSVVRDGPARGKTLGQLVKEWGTGLMGRAELFEGRFPLLIKFLDAQQDLSVQVHPDEAMARKLGGNVRVKNEAWYVLHAEPDGAIYHGFRDGVTRESFAAAISEGRVPEMLKRIPVKKGHCYYLPSGTIHALGAGVVVAEVQTPSDITYRVYDWDRIDASTGKGRELHIEQAMECIHFDSDTSAQQERSHVGSVWTSVTRLVLSDSFILERVRMVEGVNQEIPTGELIVWIVLEGKGRVTFDNNSETLSFASGDTVLIPAGLGAARIETLDECVWIEATIPLASDLADFPRPDRSTLNEPDDHGLIQITLPSQNEKSL